MASSAGDRPLGRAPARPRRRSARLRLLLPLFGLLVALLLVPALGGEFFAYQLGLFLIYGMVTQGIALAWGRTGFLPLGQSLFFGLGAYVCGLVLRTLPDPAAAPGGAPVLDALLPAAAGIIAAIALPAAFGWVVGRLVFARRHESGPYFSLITLALAMLGFQVANQWSSLTGGFNGLGGIPDLPGTDRYGNLYYVVAAASLAVTALYAWLATTPLGTLWSAISQNEDRVQFFGFATDRLKAAAFAIGAATAGLGGALYAAHQGLVTPQATGFLLSAEFVIWTAVGGRASPYGALLGAVGIGLLSAELRDHVSYWEAIVAAVFIVVVIRFPGGLLGALQAGVRALFRARPARPARPAADGMATDRYSHGDGDGDGGAIPAPRVRHAGSADGRSAPALAFEAVRSRSGGVTILDGLTMEIGSGGIHCLIGPNGAGKTSAFNVLTGRLPLADGTIRLHGRDVSRMRADAIARLGVGRKFQIPSVFPLLSVADNLRIALWANRLGRRASLGRAPRRWRSPMLDLVTARVDFLRDIPAREGPPAGSLSQGQRQVLELAMTVLSEPRLLLLDEPCAGLSPGETRRQIAVIEESVRVLGATALIVEHDMAAVEALARRVHVLHQGRLLASGGLADIQADPAVRAVYAGGRK